MMDLVIGCSHVCVIGVRIAGRGVVSKLSPVHQSFSLGGVTKVHKVHTFTEYSVHIDLLAPG